MTRIYKINPRICIFCGIEYKPTSTVQKICGSRECKQKLKRRSALTYYYKNSETIYEKSKPYCKKKYSRQKALRLVKKLNWEMKCSVCGDNKNKIDVHHIDKNPFNNEISNLTLLCRFCHAKLHP
jgi:hypothetical protein